jgi:hypothetical protein
VKDPIIINVTIKPYILMIGYSLCNPDKYNLSIGRVESIELNGMSLQIS